MGTCELIPSIAATVVPFSPTTLAGLVNWYSFDDVATLWKDTARTSPVTADGDAILGVTDKSGAGNHLSEATNGPRYTIAGQNGLSVARFDGTNDTLAGVAAADTTHTWVVVGAKRSAPSGSSRHIMQSGFSATLFTNSGVHATQWCYFAGTGAASVTFGGTAASATILVARLNSSASLDLWANGGAKTNTDPDDTVGTNSVVAFGSTVAPSQFGDYDLFEGFRYNSALSLANLNLLGSWVGSKWGISWTTAT